jgi:hypothetical protein
VLAVAGVGESRLTPERPSIGPPTGELRLSWDWETGAAESEGEPEGAPSLPWTEGASAMKGRPAGGRKTTRRAGGEWRRETTRQARDERARAMGKQGGGDRQEEVPNR